MSSASSKVNFTSAAVNEYAVVPPDTLAEGEADRTAVILHGPADGELRDGIEVLVEPHESVEYLIGDRVGVAGSRNGGVEGAWVSALRHDERGLL